MKIRTISPITPGSRMELVSYCTLFAVTLVFCQVTSGVTITDGVNLGSTNTVPTGSNSIASGFSNHVGNGSMAFGNDNTADNYSFVIGDASRADWGSLSAGYLNTVDSNSYYALLAGEGNYSGWSGSSVLLGAYNSMGLQWGSAAIGNYNTMQFYFGKAGSGNALLGLSNSIHATTSADPNTIEGTVLVGTNNTSSSTMAFAFGLGNIGQSETVTIGTYAQPVSNAALIVGRGANPNARSNGIVVLKNGVVQIEGSLVVGGSPVLSQVTASAFLQSQGFVNTSYLSANEYLKQSGLGGALVTASPPLSSSAWTDAFVPRGDVSNDGLLALGIGSASSGNESLALGRYSRAFANYSSSIGPYSQALGDYSTALGTNSMTGTLALEATAIGGGFANGAYSSAFVYASANGDASFATQVGTANGQCSIALSGLDWVYGGGNIANGENSTAIGGINNKSNGFSSLASGYWTESDSAYSVALGSMNSSLGGSTTDWIETDALFQLGNGWTLRSSANPPPALRSNAITTLKNGQTTLTNKEWKAHPSTPLADPAGTTDSGGEALVVEGHTRLKGKVIIEQPQGDISMGIYGGN